VLAFIVPSSYFFCLRLLDAVGVDPGAVPDGFGFEPGCFAGVVPDGFGFEPDCFPVVDSGVVSGTASRGADCATAGRGSTAPFCRSLRLGCTR
jgi:hypothetical protein